MLMKVGKRGLKEVHKGVSCEKDIFGIREGDLSFWGAEHYGQKGREGGGY